MQVIYLIGINLFVLAFTLLEQCHRIIAIFILKPQIFKGCKTKFSVDATQKGKGHCYRRDI